MIKKIIFAIATFLAGISAANAATVNYNIMLNAQSTTFQAPMGGGAISGLSVTLGGVTFDTPMVGSPPLYNPVTNDIAASGSLFGYFTNATAAAGCPVGECVLEFETAINNMVPPVFAAFNAVNFVSIFAFGTYVITPAPIAAVPLPAPGILLVFGLSALVVLRRRRSVDRVGLVPS